MLASSITAVGFQSTAFRPLQVPIPDEHPYLDRNGYGLSKFLMEEISKYCARQADDIDVVNLRLCTIFPEDSLPPLKTVSPLPSVTYALGGLTVMAMPDAVRAFSLAAEAPLQPGVRILNAAGPKAWATVVSEHARAKAAGSISHEFRGSESKVLCSATHRRWLASGRCIRERVRSAIGHRHPSQMAL